VGLRAAIIALALWWAWRAWLAGRESVRRRQLSAMLAAVAFSALGGVLTILLAQLHRPVWPGTSLIVLALALAGYSVLVQRLFLAPDVARRSFVYSLVTGLVTAGYVALLIGIERVSRAVLGVQSPLVTGLALVLTIAWFDPVRLRFRAWLDRWMGSGDIAYSQLLRAMGDELVTSQRPESAIRSALAQMCRTLGIRSASVEASGGKLVAWHGPGGGKQPAQLSLPLRAGERDIGLMLVGPKRSRLPYTPVEKEILSHAAAYIGASLQLAERRTEQAAALQALSAEREALRSREAALTEALVHAEKRPDGDRLHVWALGPLRVERNGETIQRWGGAKAGTRQAEAVFAFLFDRGERGVAKDEFVEVIWPDVPLDRADLAFHRTLGGLRRMLEPQLKHGSEATSITYHNDRYRLNGEMIAYSDVVVFVERIAQASGARNPEEAIAALEEARGLYRGEYLDDCPFYGDSTYVEEKRSLLRGRYIDVLLALGERYERAGNQPAAAAAYREALQTAGDDCPRADDGLARLGLPL
jgi:DNA-binding SARP family transcriptional activator